MNKQNETGPQADRTDASAWLSAIVDHSNDAILSKTLDGIITSWNGGAERLFGFTAAEAIGQPITLIIPDDRLHEEEEIIARLRAGQRVERFETVRHNRNGDPVHIEVNISPVRDRSGRIIGASKIARDIGERKRHVEELSLIAREMHHRIKNLLSIVQALISVGRRRAEDVDGFADELTSRIAALASAQQLLLRPVDGERGVTLGQVFETVLAPYAANHVAIAPSTVPVGETAVTSLALLLHELATNAAKYGALANAAGRLDIAISAEAEAVAVRWCEWGGGAPDETRHGFGSDLMKAALRGLNGSMERAWDGERLTVSLRFDRQALGH